MAKIVNPETWDDDTEGMDFEQKGIYVQQLVNHYEQLKEKKQNKKPKKAVFVIPTQDEVVEYFNSKGYTKDSALKFHNYYSEGNPPWHDSVGHPIRSWKQKAQAVWFKEENKQSMERKIAR